MRFLQLVSLLTSFSVYAQLDPLFFGSYKDQLGQEMYSIYTMDEVAEDCFLVDYQQFENGQLIRSSSGYGHCDGQNGHMEIKLMDENQPQEVAFQLSDDESRTMTRYFSSGEKRTYFASSSVEVRSGDNERELYYRRADGVELTFRFNEDAGSYTFSIYQPASGDCKGGEYSGKLQPVNEELTEFTHTPFSTCVIRLFVSKDITHLQENGAEGLHPNCSSWAGTFLLNH